MAGRVELGVESPWMPWMPMPSQHAVMSSTVPPGLGSFGRPGADCWAKQRRLVMVKDWD